MNCSGFFSSPSTNQSIYRVWSRGTLFAKLFQGGLETLTQISSLVNTKDHLQDVIYKKSKLSVFTYTIDVQSLSPLISPSIVEAVLN